MRSDVLFELLLNLCVLNCFLLLNSEGVQIMTAAYFYTETSRLL